MKYILALILVLVPISALAAPHLYCDPYPQSVTQPTYFKVSFNGGGYVDSPAFTNPDGSVVLKYDLASLSNGIHTVKAQACGVWGCSVDSLPFTFTRGVANPPSGFRIQ